MDFILHILQTILLISTVIGIVWLVDRVFGKRAGYRWRKILWLVLAVRLLFPVPISLNAAVDSFRGLEIAVNIPEQLVALPEKMEQADVNAYQPVGAANPGVVQDNNEEQGTNAVHNADAVQNSNSVLSGEDALLKTGTAGPAKQISAVGIIGILWLGGALIMLALHFYQYSRMKKVYLTGTVLCEKQDILEQMRCICEELGIKRQIPIRIMKQEDSCKSPMLFGYLKPALLLPDVSYKAYELDAILKHELSHYRAKDLWYKLLMVIVCDLYWFNPVFKLMKSMAFRDVECVCDEKATCNMDLDAKKEYSSIILKTMSRTKGTGFAFTTQFAGTKKNAKERLNNIFSVHNRKAGIGILCLLLLLLVTGTACVSFTASEKEEEPAVPEEEVTTPLDENSTMEETAGQEKSVTIEAGILPEDSAGLLSELEEQYPDYHFLSADLTFNQTEEFFAQAPTVFRVGNSDMLVQSLADEGRVADITDVLAERGWLDQMDDALKMTVSDSNGRIYGIPCVPYAYGVIVNVEMFAQAGITDEEGIPIFPATWEELADAAVKIKEATGEAGLCLIANDQDVSGSIIFLNIAQTFGVENIVTVEVDGSYRAHLDSDACIAAMEFVKDLKWKYDVLTEDPTKEEFLTGYEHLANNTAAMYIGGDDSLVFATGYGMEAAGLALGAMPAGPDGGRHSSFGQYVLVFRADAEPEEIDAVLSLIELLGLGPVANDAAKSRIYDRLESAVKQGAPVIPEIAVWNNEELLTYEQSVIAEIGNTDQALYQSYFEEVHTPGYLNGLDIVGASELCDVVSAVLEEVVTNSDADVEELMKEANDSYQKVLDVFSSER